MSDLLFGCSTPQEYVAWLDWEYEGLSGSSGERDTKAQVYHALDFASVAWHLANMVFNYPETHSALAERGIRGFPAFLKHVFSLCPELRICYDLSIEFKHYKDNQSTASTVGSTARVPKRGLASIHGMAVAHLASFQGVPIAHLASIHGIPLFVGNRLIVTKADGAKVDFLDVARSVKAFWQREIESLMTP